MTLKVETHNGDAKTWMRPVADQGLGNLLWMRLKAPNFLMIPPFRKRSLVIIKTSHRLMQRVIIYKYYIIGCNI